MKKSQRLALRWGRLDLIEGLAERKAHPLINDVMPVLINDGICHTSDEEEICHQKRGRDRVTCFLDLLPTRGPDAFDTFCFALACHTDLCLVSAKLKMFEVDGEIAAIRDHSVNEDDHQKNKQRIIDDAVRSRYLEKCQEFISKEAEGARTKLENKAKRKSKQFNDKLSTIRQALLDASKGNEAFTAYASRSLTSERSELDDFFSDKKAVDATTGIHHLHQYLKNICKKGENPDANADPATCMLNETMETLVHLGEGSPNPIDENHFKRDIQNIIKVVKDMLKLCQTTWNKLLNRNRNVEEGLKCLSIFISKIHQNQIDIVKTIESDNSHYTKKDIGFEISDLPEECMLMDEINHVYEQLKSTDRMNNELGRSLHFLINNIHALKEKTLSNSVQIEDLLALQIDLRKKVSKKQKKGKHTFMPKLVESVNNLETFVSWFRNSYAIESLTLIDNAVASMKAVNSKEEFQSVKDQHLIKIHQASHFDPPNPHKGKTETTLLFTFDLLQSLLDNRNTIKNSTLMVQEVRNKLLLLERHNNMKMADETVTVLIGEFISDSNPTLERISKDLLAMLEIVSRTQKSEENIKVFYDKILKHIEKAFTKTDLDEADTYLLFEMDYPESSKFEPVLKIVENILDKLKWTRNNESRIHSSVKSLSNGIKAAIDAAAKSSSIEELLTFHPEKHLQRSKYESDFRTAVSNICELLNVITEKAGIEVTLLRKFLRAISSNLKKITEQIVSNGDTPDDLREHLRDLGEQQLQSQDNVADDIYNLLVAMNDHKKCELDSLKSKFKSFVEVMNVDLNNPKVKKNFARDGKKDLLQEIANIIDQPRTMTFENQSETSNQADGSHDNSTKKVGSEQKTKICLIL